MFNRICKASTIICFFLLSIITGKTQSLANGDDSAYIKVITERSAKITATLGLDSIKRMHATTILVNQYSSLNRIHEQHKALITAKKQQPGLAKEDMAAAVKQLEDQRDSLLKKQHAAYLKKLASVLTPTQIDEVKNGMTYNLVNVTYNAYVDMIPTLKEEEKQKIRGWLIEARELAMDAGSSDGKHAIFGKYKGRINNYISAQGYDAQKERENWEARLKAKKANAASSN